jgi:hypothetical protein
LVGCKHEAKLKLIVTILKSYLFSFCLNKKKQKFKAKDQPPFAPQNLLRMAVRSLSPKPAALLPTYDKFQKNYLSAPSAKSA